MKKRIIAALCAGVALLNLSGCSGFKEYFKLNEITTVAPSASGEENSSDTVFTSPAAESSFAVSESGSSTADPSSTPQVSTSVSVSDVSTSAEATIPVDAPVSTAPATQSDAVGFTSKGYRIEQRDGLTYIDDVLIVNKTYSVPADYSPGDLTDECRVAFRELQDAAEAEAGLSFYVVSGYRSFSTQDGLYNRYVARDGQAEADTYSARPGHSEHQTGLAIDVNSVTYAFADTPEGQWLAANAHRFGFIIRYPQSKQSVTGYAYEPWHIRYVGKTLAPLVYDSGLCLEEYFGITSVYA